MGEAGLTGRELAVIGAIEHFKPLLIGQDPCRIEHLWQVLFRGGFFPAERDPASAISAIDIALWDIKGKALGVPVYELLGGRVRDRVVCYPHNSGHATEVGPLVDPASDEGRGLEVRALGPPDDGELLEPRVAVSTAICSSSRPCARPSATRSKSSSTCIPASTCPMRFVSAARRAVSPVLHRRPPALREPGFLQDATAAHRRAAGRG